MKAERAALEAHRKYKATDLGTMLDDVPLSPAPMVEAKVVKPTFGKGRSAPVPDRPSQPSQLPLGDVAAAQAAVIADLAAMRAPKAEPSAEDTARERFRRALQLERAMETGEAVTAEQQRWLSVYQQSAEYRAERGLWSDFGDTIFG